MWLRDTKLLAYLKVTGRFYRSPWLGQMYFLSDIPCKKSKLAPLQERRMIDRFRLWAKGGDGGNGCTSFRRSRNDRLGIPDGGNGGRGGDVILECSPSIWDLSSLQHHINAKRGRHGASKNMIGSRGDDKVVQVPVGTVIHLIEGELPCAIEKSSSEALNPWEIPGSLDMNSSELSDQTGTKSVKSINTGDASTSFPRTDDGVLASHKQAQAMYSSSHPKLTPSSNISRIVAEASKSMREESCNAAEAEVSDDVMSDAECEKELEATESIQYNVAELTKPGQRIIVACGGDGGSGNVSLGRAPKKTGKDANVVASDNDEHTSRTIGLPGPEQARTHTHSEAYQSFRLAHEETTMAATVSAWAKPGAWALDSEEHEAELVQQKKDDFFIGKHLSNGNGNGSGDYPTLAAATSTKTKKKSKGQTLSLHEFSAYGTTVNQQPSQANKGLTADELLSLPTGPRQRSAEELERSKGFRSYGSRDEQPRRQRDSNRDLAPPSRADEIDDWGAAKKSTAPNGSERRERREGGGFFSDSLSRADEVDNWASNKTFVPSDGRRHERRGGFDSNGGGGGGADSENWVKRKEEDGRKFGSGGGAFDSLRERRGGGLDSVNGGNGVDSDNWGKKREESVGRPRLNLQPRTLPIGDGQQQNNESLLKPKGSSPFGDARPREEVLKEKGHDWKEIEEKLESGKIKEAGEEKQATFGKRGFGSGNWRGSLQEDRNDRTWRKPELVDTPPSSAEKTEDGPGEEAEDKEQQI